jgi:hypothetical protein
MLLLDPVRRPNIFRKLMYIVPIISLAVLLTHGQECEGIPGLG